MLSLVTVFLGCGFAAKYREGGGNFSVPLQWMLGLAPAETGRDLARDSCPRPMTAPVTPLALQISSGSCATHGLAGRYCLLYQETAGEEHDLAAMRCIGLSRRKLRERLAGPNVLLNLSYSLHPPLLLEFERRIFCDLDPGEILYWMTKLEMGQSHHHEFWTIGLNVHGADCRLPKSPLAWRTFFPLVDTQLLRPRRRPPADGRSLPRSDNGIGTAAWRWMANSRISRSSTRFAPYLDLPARVPEAALGAGDEYQCRMTRRRCGCRQLGWQLIASA